MSNYVPQIDASGGIVVHPRQFECACVCMYVCVCVYVCAFIFAHVIHIEHKKK